MLPSLFLKFKVESDCYIFDSCSNEILQVSPVVYDIITDFLHVEDEVIVQKYSISHDAQSIREALTALKQISNERFLCTDYPPSSLIASAVCCEKKRYEFDEFLSKFSAMLILELTQKCNLECSYCIYGKYYHRHKSRTTDSISYELAELAIKTHLDKFCSGRTITFYGGEPLLEFDLMRELILFAEQYCRETGKEKPEFSLTTNGTLLNDRIIHFLVEHECSILISIDGDQKTHDRYRVFKSNGQGSFDTIEKNLQLFTDLYPYYNKRGIIITLTSSTDFFLTNDFLKKYFPAYPSILANFAESYLGSDCEVPSNDCGNNCIKFSSPISEQASPDFLMWTNDVENKWCACNEQFQTDVLSFGIEAKKRWPLLFHGYAAQMRRLHERKIKSPQSGRVACCCIPGAIRIYCDINGNYYPCERVEFRDSFKIGDVWSGVDAKKVSKMVNYMSEVTECGKCVGKNLCGVCPAIITESKTNQYSDLRIKSHCQTISNDLIKQLSQYVSLLKKQPNFFVKPSDIDVSLGNSEWTKHVSFIAKPLS